MSSVRRKIVVAVAMIVAMLSLAGAAGADTAIMRCGYSQYGYAYVRTFYAATIYGWGTLYKPSTGRFEKSPVNSWYCGDSDGCYGSVIVYPGGYGWQVYSITAQGGNAEILYTFCGSTNRPEDVTPGAQAEPDAEL